MSALCLANLSTYMQYVCTPDLFIYLQYVCLTRPDVCSMSVLLVHMSAVYLANLSTYLQYVCLREDIKKLDGVGPVDNRPYTD